MRELVEVLPDPEDVADAPDIRPTRWCAAAAVYVLSARRAGDGGQYRRALADADHRVRIEAVRALVSVDDADGVAAAPRDDNREVRIAVANGLGTLRTGADAVRGLIGDRDPLVRAAALAAIGADRLRRRRRGRPSSARWRESAWQIRAGRRPRAGRSAVADGRRAAAVARAVRSAPRRAQGRGAEPDPVGGVGGRGARGARAGAGRRRRRRACLRPPGAGRALMRDFNP